MSRIALTWELGANFGHVSKLAMLAEGLVERGHEVVYLLRDLAGTQVLGSDLVLQAPLWLKETRGFPDPPLNYSEMLLRYGYHSASSLGELTAAWCASYKLFKPDVVVAEHAPTSLLAARILRIPSAVIGEGFTVPPRQAPMPNMRPWASVQADRLNSSDSMVLDHVNAVLREHGCQLLTSVSSLLEVEQRFLCTFAELDHYSGRLGETYLGPLYQSHGGAEPVWPENAGKKVFVYMWPSHRDFNRMIELLSALGWNALICAPGIADSQRKMLETDFVRISSQKFQLSKLSNCDLAITFGSSGVGAAMLLAGIPILMLPTHLEQFLISSRIQEIGAGKVVNPESPPVSYVELLRELIESPVYRENAQRFAAKYKDYDQDKMVDKVVERIEMMAGSDAL